jgi:mRNA interferase MazF
MHFFMTVPYFSSPTFLAVVVSSDAYNQKRPDIIIMAVTSQMGAAAYFGDVTISQWQPAGLLKPSVIKPIVATIEKSLVIKKLGRVKKEDRSSLRESFNKILGE